MPSTAMRIHSRTLPAQVTENDAGLEIFFNGFHGTPGMDKTAFQQRPANGNAGQQDGQSGRHGKCVRTEADGLFINVGTEYGNAR